QVHGPDSAEYADALARLAATMRSRDKAVESAGLYEQARAILTRAGSAGAESLAVVEIDESLLANDQERYADATRELNQAIAYYESTGRTSTYEYFSALHNLAGTFYRQGDPVKAIPIL